MRIKLRGRVTALVESRGFQGFIIGVIVINAIILGVETYPGLPETLRAALTVVNQIAVTIFVIEIVLRIYAHRRRFFADPWGWFDLAIVLIALVPASNGSEVLRVLRALRILRLLSTVRSMRLVVGALIASMPGIASIGALLGMVLYIYAVMTTVLYQPAPAFADLGTSVTSLFRVLVGDGWGDVVIPVVNSAWDWLLFISFAIISAIVVLNLFIAVAVEAMDRVSLNDPAPLPGATEATSTEATTAEPDAPSTGDPAAAEGPATPAEPAVAREPAAAPAARPEDAELLAEIRALRAQVAELSERLPQR